MKLRVGRHWGHNLYRVNPDGTETPVGQALSPELAAEIVEAVNAEGSVREAIERSPAYTAEQRAAVLAALDEVEAANRQ